MIGPESPVTPELLLDLFSMELEVGVAEGVAGDGD